MANPVIDFTDTTFLFNELANTIGSAFVHEDTLIGTLADDNEPSYTTTFDYIPDPTILPGEIFVFISYLFSDPPPNVDGDIDVDYSVEDSDLDFLREGITVTQEIDITVTDQNTGESTTETFAIEITGANDTPTARIDKQGVSEDVAFVVNRVIGNDTDPDIGDTLVLTPAGFRIKSVSNTGKEQFLTKQMVKIEQINFLNPGSPQAAKDAIKTELAQAFQGLMKGEKAKIVVEYGITDDFGGLSATTFTITVRGNTDKQIVGTNATNRFLIGEADQDTILGLKGNDIIDARGGNDILVGGAGKDKLNGNKGQDTASYEQSNKGVTANLAKPGDNTRDAAGDTYVSIENLTGSFKADTLIGDNGSNRIAGLFGNDVLTGGKGKDVLDGGAGRDTIIGGGGADRVVISAVEESLPSRKLMDKVLGFSRKQGDRFDLRKIDADQNSKKSNDEFTFIGTEAFAGNAGELRFEKNDKQTIVLGDTNGDGLADFGFQLMNSLNLSEGDFFL